MKRFLKNIRLLVALSALISSISLCYAQSETNVHVVDRGETIESIASKYGLTKNQLIEVNPDAKDFVYVGMELIIPSKPATKPTVSISNHETKTDDSSAATITKIENNASNALNTTLISKQDAETTIEDEFDSERMKYTIEYLYTASTFKYVKASGSYGISMSWYPWKIAEKFYGGLHLSPLNFNYGLSKPNFDQIRVGPALAYYFTPKIFLAMPLYVFCNVVFSSKTKTGWGMALAPSIFVGSHAGIFVGPLFSIGFVDNSDVYCGFRAGFYF